MINSRLFPPLLRSDTVERRRLTDLINTDPHQRIVVIEAPAGYGKSTLAAQWLAEQEMPVAWVTLDAQDNDPQRFFQLMINVLRGLGPGIGAEAHEVLGQVTPLLGSGFLDELTAALGMLAAPCALVLDDYHVLRDESVHRLLGELLRKLPGQMRVLIVTRTRLPIPLSRLRARGAVLDLGVADLRLTDSEAAQLLGDQNLVLTNADILRLNERTEGWPAGLRLTWHALLRQPGDRIHALVEQMTGHHEPLNSFLWEEVLSELPSSVLDFLTGCAIFDRFSAPLCEVVLGTENSREQIREIHTANLFVIPLDVEGDWYRFHPLLRDVLQQRWEDRVPADERVGIHRLAATWFEAHGLVDEAVRHAVAANDLVHAGALLVPIADVLYRKDQVASLRVRLADLPPALFEEYPKLGFYLAWELARTGQTRASVQALEETEATGADRTDAVEPGQIALLKAFQCVVMSDFAQAIALADEALILIPAGRDEERILASLFKARALIFLGKPREAEAVLASYQGGQLARGSGVRVVDAIYSGLILTVKGKLNEAAMLLEQVSTFTTGPTFMQTQQALSHLGLIHLEHNALDLAEAAFRRGLRLSDEVSTHLWQGRFHFGLALVAQARGDRPTALRWLETSISAYEQVDSLYDVRRAQALQARIWIEQGQLPLARRWFELTGIALQPDQVTYEQFSGQLTAVRLLLAEGDQEEVALAHLDLLREAAIADERLGEVIEIDVLRALTYQAQQAMPEALAAMESALELAEPGGYVRVFINEAAEPLLRQFADGGQFQAYAALLLEAIRQPNGPNQSQLQRPLSQREVEVTRLIGAGYSNQAIADELFIAETTVRKHVTRIFSKLQVSNRIQAFNLAREYGLIDE